MPADIGPNEAITERGLGDISAWLHTMRQVSQAPYMYAQQLRQDIQQTKHRDILREIVLEELGSQLQPIVFS